MHTVVTIGDMRDAAPALILRYTQLRQSLVPVAVQVLAVSLVNGVDDLAASVTDVLAKTRPAALPVNGHATAVAAQIRMAINGWELKLLIVRGSSTYVGGFVAG